MIEINRFEEVTQIKMSLEVDERPVNWTAAYLFDRGLIDTDPKHIVEELMDFLEGKTQFCSKHPLARGPHWCQQTPL